LADSTEAGPVRYSARNRLIGIVTRVRKDPVMSQVDLAAGPFRMVSLISTEAVDELGLDVGVMVVASVKATHVTLEAPRVDGGSATGDDGELSPADDASSPGGSASF
jgi:molybdopterin-binding protein